MTKSQRGGAREGAGRPKKFNKLITFTFMTTPEHHQAFYMRLDDVNRINEGPEITTGDLMCLEIDFLLKYLPKDENVYYRKRIERHIDQEADNLLGAYTRFTFSMDETDRTRLFDLLEMFKNMGFKCSASSLCRFMLENGNMDDARGILSRVSKKRDIKQFVKEL